MKRKWWVILACLAFLTVAGWLWASGGRALWSIESHVLTDKLVVSPQGDVVIQGWPGLVLIDRDGRRHPLVHDKATLVPLASTGERGLIALRISRTNSETILFDWQGQPQWTYPAGNSQPELSPDGLIFFFGTGRNFYVLNPDGSLRWQRRLVGRGRSETPRLGTILAVGRDGSVALRTENDSDGILLFERDGALRWELESTLQKGYSYMTRDDEGGVIQAANDWLRSVSPQGEVRWKVTFPPDIPAEDAARRSGAPLVGGVQGLAVSDLGLIYCRSTDGLVYVLDADGHYRWSWPAGARGGAGSGWIVFDQLGNAILGTAKDHNLKSVTTTTQAAGGQLMRYAQTDSRLVCLSPEGKLLWNHPLGGDFNLFRPTSKQELHYMWETRLGLREWHQTRALTLGPDGRLYFLRYNWATRQGKLHAIQGDPPAE
jgi:outer membrane protein assembly factor BamB